MQKEIYFQVIVYLTPLYRILKNKDKKLINSNVKVTCQLEYLFDVRNSFQTQKQNMEWKIVTYENSNSQLPSERWGHRLVLTNTNELVLFGGFGGSSNEGKYLQDLWTFSTESCTWRPLATRGQMPQSRSNYTVHYDSVGEQIILYGGGSNNRMRYTSVCILDWKTKEWTQCLPEEAADAPWERTYHCSQFSYPYLIVHGGEGVANMDLDDMWAFNIIDRRWRQVRFDQNELGPRKRRFHSSVLVGNYLYIMGGCTGNFHLLGDMYRVNLASLFQNHCFTGFKWELVTRKNKLLERWGHSSELYNGKIYISCGRISATADTNDTFTYDLERGSFEKVEADSSEIVPRRRHASVIVGNCLLLFGGYNGKYLNDFHYLPLKTQEATENCNFQRIIIENIQDLQQALIQEQNNCNSDLYIQLKANHQTVYNIKTNKNKLVSNQFMTNMLNYSSSQQISIELPGFCDVNTFRIIHLGIIQNKLIICNKFTPELIVNLVQANEYFVCKQANKAIEQYLVQILNYQNCMQILQLSSYFGFQKSQKSAAEFYLIHHQQNLDQKFISFQKMMQHHIHLQVGSPEENSEYSRDKESTNSNILQQAYSHIKFDLKQMKLRQQSSNFLEKAARHLKIALRRTSSKQDEVPSAKLKRNSSEKQFGCFERFRKFISGVLMTARVHHEGSHQA